MGRMILREVIQKLDDEGILTQRGYPSQKRRIISEPVCAVNLKQADMRSKVMTVTVRVLSPAEQGAGVCEDKAVEIGQILTDLGGKCTVGACGFDGSAGVFCTEITAEYPTQTPRIRLNGVELKHVLAFTSWRTLDEEVSDWDNAKWNFRLEEYFPMGEDEDSGTAGTFSLMHISEQGSEEYSGCTWTYQRRVWDASGVRQLRLGVADLMDLG